MLNRRKTEKLDSRKVVCLFISYPKGRMRGIFDNPREKKVFMSTHAAFLKSEYMNDFKHHSKLLLEEISEKKSLDDSTRFVGKGIDSLTTRVIDIDNEIENITDKPSQKVIMPRHSGRIRKPQDRYEANLVVPNINDEDLSTYEDAMMDTDKEK